MVLSSQMRLAIVFAMAVACASISSESGLESELAEVTTLHESPQPESALDAHGSFRAGFKSGLQYHCKDITAQSQAKVEGIYVNMI